VNAYFDTSALLKLVIEEEGSDLAGALWDQADAVAANRLAYPEARAALAAARRSRRLTSLGLAQAKAGLEDLIDQLRVIEVSEPIARAVGELAERVAFRGNDAVHLASALAAAGDGLLVFVTWDADLAKAARSAGLAIAPRA
jgi:predicted nucleic acid-binding protein